MQVKRSLMTVLISHDMVHVANSVTTRAPGRVLRAPVHRCHLPALRDNIEQASHPITINPTPDTKNVE